MPRLKKALSANPSASSATSRPRSKCELCSREDRSSQWVEVVPEGEGISCVTVDVTLRLCPEHRARLLQAVNREDADNIEPPKYEGMGWGTTPNGKGK
jgi:Fe-S-cluster-containing hydrogenase component 2